MCNLCLWAEVVKGKFIILFEFGSFANIGDIDIEKFSLRFLHLEDRVACQEEQKSLPLSEEMSVISKPSS